jgi:hypothetical protein
MAPIQDGGGTDTELFLSELSSSPDQDATIQFSHERFVPPDSLNPAPGDHHPEIAPFLNIEQPVSLLPIRPVRQMHRPFPLSAV